LRDFLRDYGAIKTAVGNTGIKRSPKVRHRPERASGQKDSIKNPAEHCGIFYAIFLPRVQPRGEALCELSLGMSSKALQMQGFLVDIDGYIGKRKMIIGNILREERLVRVKNLFLTQLVSESAQWVDPCDIFSRRCNLTTSRLFFCFCQLKI
jgi:hypothetical protein